MLRLQPRQRHLSNSLRQIALGRSIASHATIANGKPKHHCSDKCAKASLIGRLRPILTSGRNAGHERQAPKTTDGQKTKETDTN